MELSRTIQRATSAVSQLVGDDGAQSVGADLWGEQASVGEARDDAFRFDDALACFDALFSRGVGAAANEALDRLGVPDVVGDVVGVVLDIGTMNYLGAGVNAMDAGADIARAAGKEQLAGYLDAATPVAKQISGVIGRAAMIVATGGASGAATASAGGLSMSAQGFTQTLSMVRGGLAAADNLQRGDWAGAALEGFGALGDFGPLGEALGVAPDILSRTSEVAEHGARATRVLQQVLADGELDLSDLQHVPTLELLGAAGVEVEGREDIIGAAVGLVAGEGAPDVLWDTFAGELVDAVLTRADGEADAESHQALEFFGDLLTASHREPELVRGLEVLLQRLDAGSQRVDLARHHSGKMRV